MKEYGYIRVSSKDQNPDRQFIALEDVGIQKENIFIDFESGKDFNRKNYRKLIKTVKKDDTLFIKAIDRLGRNYDEIIEQWAYLTKKKEIDIVVLDCPILDTRTKKNGLTGRVITDIFLQLISYVAQIERDNIKQRQLEGIIAAKAKGVKFGRPKMEIPEEFSTVYYKWKTKTISCREASRRLHVNRNTFLRWVDAKENKEEENFLN